MIAMQVIFYVIAFVSAFGLALFLTLLLGGGVAFNTRHGRYVIPAIILCLVAASGFATLLSGRDINLIGLYLDSENGGVGGFFSSMLQRSFSVMALTLSGAVIMTHLLNPAKTQLMEAVPLLQAYLFYFFTNAVMNALFGAHPTFIYNNYYSFPIILALFIGFRQDPELLERSVKTLLLAYLIFSLAAAAALPKVALQTGYPGWIPGFSVRLYGLAPHPNVLAPVSLVVLLLEWSRPYRNRFMHRLTLVVALAVFVLTQSKTTWAAAMVALVVIAIVQSTKLFSDAMSGKKEGTLVVRIGLGLLLLSLFVGGLAAIFLLHPDAIWNRFMQTTAGSSVENISGRMPIWQQAITEWLRNPVFGFGPTIWELEYRIKVGLLTAFHAHNQYLQSLSSAGLVGLIGLLVYLWVLGRASFPTAITTKGITLAMFAVLLLRTMTETPLPTQSIISPDFLVHIALLAAILNGLCAKQIAPATTAISLRNTASATLQPATR